MEFNKNVVRILLINIENKQLSDDFLNVLTAKNVHDNIQESLEYVEYYLHILSEGGFIDLIENGEIFINRLTYKGQSLLDNIRNQQVWDTVLAKTSKLNSVSLDVISITAENVVLELIDI
ncbi:DUF2513 domain-containing protein [Convivina intestini]|uniref:Uncharacterized protein DUF2513 n=1 Tax=Convivina intestini TaxID=1505726 RepID=A0A2U1D7H1_9LACO|nr:DUF2513 domain-containing protein [Convivina intestini]PVY83482.1 uncharacterized protein DUF2513 [Convivina intestini]SDC23214.1 Hypothetical protein SAMN05216341_1262 [Leuconostocaceae bacterium R-53105]